MRKFAVLVFLVLLVAGLTWWVAAGGSAESPTDGRDAPAEVDTDPEPERPQRKRVRRTDDPVPNEAAPEPADPEPAEIPFEVIAEADSGGLLNVVTHDGEKATEVIVRFLPFDPEAPSPELRRLNDPYEGALQFGRALRTDREGRVFVPRFPVAAIVAVRTNAQRGFMYIPRGNGPWTLELAEIRVLEVRVLDAQNEPVRTDVVLVGETEWGEWPLARATSDETGTARLESDTDTLDAEDSDWKLHVRPAGPLVDPPRVTIDPRNLPEETIVLVLPGTGGLRVTLVDPVAPATPTPFDVTVRPVAEDSAPHGQQPERVDAVSRPIRAGTAAALAPVGLGLRLLVEVRATDGSRATVREEVVGPVTAGESVAVEINAGPPRPVLTVRLVDPNGEGLAGLTVLSEILEPGDGDGDHAARQEHTTDERGRIEFAVDVHPGASGGRKLRLGRHVAARGGVSAEDLATLDLPSVLVQGTNDLGDVTYAGTQELLAGTVFDADGAPAAGAVIQVMEHRHGMRSPMDGIDEVVADAEGRFTISGAVDEGPIHLGVKFAGQFLDRPPNVKAGDRDVRVQLARAGGLAGSLKLPEGMDAWDVRVLVSGPAQDTNDTDYRFPGEGLALDLGEDGAFASQALRPGRADVTISLGHGPDDALLTIEGLTIVAGETLRDPRLQNIDLSAGLHAIDVKVTTADGKPVGGAMVSHTAPGSDRSWDRGETEQDGVAKLRVRSETIRIVVTHPGYRAVERASIASDTTIVLEPVPVSTVTIRLAKDVVLPEPPYELAASLSWIGGPNSTDLESASFHDPRSPESHHFDSQLGKDRKLVLEAWEPGRYRVRLILWKMNMSGGGGGGIGTVPEHAIVTIRGDGAPVTIDVGYDVEAYRRRVERDRE